MNGALYGTTVNGGPNNDGTVFKIDPRRARRQCCILSPADTDGYDPEASLINVKGVLYGTTYRGGPNGAAPCSGSTKERRRKGALFVLRQASCADGDGPVAGLIEVNGTLYGTTDVGGTYGQGTVFKIKLR